MSFRRFSSIFTAEFGHFLRRPLFYFLAFILLLSGWGLSTGNMQISSGDSSVGGMKAWITSEFAQTQMMTYLTLLYYAFFVALAAGLSLLKDREHKVDVLLHATPLSAGEYVWGRFLAVTAAFLILMAWQGLVNAFFNHVIPNGGAQEIRGPFHFGSYFVPILTIGVPFLIFYAGLSMAIGEWTKSPVLVFVLPIATLILCGFFLWTWAPSWLDLNVNRLLMVLEPSGYRWLNETLLKVDRGVTFYNTRSVPYDGLFWINRAWLLVLGLGSVFATQRSMARFRRGVEAKGLRRARRAKQEEPSWEGDLTQPGIAALGMKSRVPSFLASALRVARTECRELVRQNGLYIFIPLILLQTLGNVLVAVGAFDTPVFLTPGNTAAGVASQLSVFVCILLLYYTVESLERDRSTGVSAILYSTPIRTGALLFGKALANSMVGLAVLLASLLACAIALAVQGTVPFSITPYLLVWGCLLVPTFLAWTSFVSAAYAATGNRYGAIAVSLGVLIWTGFRALTRGMSWAGNWPLWGIFRWSDLGFFETDRVALIWNRIMVLGFALFFTMLAVRLFGRRGADATRRVEHAAPGRLFRSGLRLLPYAALPATACVALLFLVSSGLEGGAAKKAHKDYWAKNLKTWLNAPLPDIARADVRLKIDPPRQWLASEGELTLRNGTEGELAQIPLTGGLHWKHLAWTMNGRPVTPEDDRGLYVFTPPRPLSSGDSVRIGWKWDGRFPSGVTKDGGGTEEFILPSGVVLTGFTPSFMPVVGFMEDVGETKENKTEPKRYPRDYWKGITRAGYGATAWFPARVVLTAPERYTLNSVGIRTSDTVKDGWRTDVWETDYPVKLLNVVCGKWKVKQGRGTTIFYYSGHPFNTDEMSTTLDAARRWYSEWFLPYPWRELKLSEFPGLAGYAQGFGTDITFSENIGFLTRNDSKTDATFLVTAHEAAHQWWGNILTPANGPSGDFLSEGMAHFSTLLLFEKVRGPRGRMSFAEGIESRYGDRRRVDEERPMYDVDGKKSSDETVIYDRGGWVFWMLYDFMGHDRALAGIRSFIEKWSQSRDHPALMDFVNDMRPFAADPIRYDAFVKEWMEDRVIPEYRVLTAKKVRRADGYAVHATIQNIGTGSMPVEVAASAGERWSKPARGAPAWSSGTNPAYRESRAVVTLAAGQSKSVVIPCAFVPDRVTVDPDVRVLQLRRKQATTKV
jgi:ABC-2 type transport system permease protein